MKMTEHTDKVELQKEKILKESLDQQVTAIDIRFGRIQTRYQSGRHQEYRRSKSAWEISYRLREIKDAIEKHNNVYDNDLEINLEVADDS
jgi:hypothetical protein